MAVAVVDTSVPLAVDAVFGDRKVRPVALGPGLNGRFAGATTACNQTTRQHNNPNDHSWKHSIPPVWLMQIESTPLHESLSEYDTVSPHPHHPGAHNAAEGLPILLGQYVSALRQ